MVKQKNQKKTGGSQDGSPNSSSNAGGGGTSSSTTGGASTPRAPSGTAAPRHNNQNGQPKRDREKQVQSQNGSNVNNQQNTTQKKANGTAEKMDNQMMNGKQRENKEKNGHGSSQNSQTSNYGFSGKNKHNRDHSNSNSCSSTSKRSGGNAHNSTFPAAASSSSTSTASSKTITNLEAKLDNLAEKKEQTMAVEGVDENVGMRMEKSSTPGALDMVASFLEHGPWDRQELQCELLNLTNPIDLRLYANCIDGLASRNALQLKPLETRANSSNPTAGFPSPYQISLSQCFTEEIPNGSLNPSSSRSKSDLNRKNQTKGSNSENYSEGLNERRNYPDSDDNQLVSDSSTNNSGGDETANVLHTLYAMIALLNANNRKSAYHLAKYVEEYVISARAHHLTKVTSLVDKIQLLELMGKIVSACLRHPAFSLNDKMKYIRSRDEIQCDLEVKVKEYQMEVMNNRLKRTNLDRGVGTVDEDEVGADKGLREEMTVLTGAMPVNGHGGSHSQYSPVLSSKSPVGKCVFIERFIGCQIDKQNPDSFQIEIQWSDSEKTFTTRTRSELTVLQHRLLDEFGQERSESSRATVSMSEEDRAKSSSSSSSVNRSEACASSSSRRIIPPLLREASSAEVVQYINELSDLPARIMMSSIISQEFNSTRNKTIEGDSDIDGIVLSKFRPPPRSTDQNRQLIPSHNSHEAIYVNLHKPYVFGPVPEDHYQIVDKSCSNCGGDHEYVRCEKPTILEKKHDSVFHFDKKEVPMMPMPTSPNGAHFAYHQYEAEMAKMNEGNAVPVQFARNIPFDPSPIQFIPPPPQMNRPPPPNHQSHQYSGYGK